MIFFACEGSSTTRAPTAADVWVRGDRSTRISFDLVHHLFDHLRACVRGPFALIERLAGVQAACNLGEILVAVVVPRVDFIAVYAIDA